MSLRSWLKRRVAPENPQVRLVAEAAADLGADVVENATVPHFKSRTPDPPFGVALAPAEEGLYVPIFEAPVTGALFLEVWPSGSPYPPLRVNQGGGGVLIGDDDFDEAYVVRTDDPHFARSLLDGEARSLIEAGRKIGRGGRIRLNVDRLRVRLRKEEALSSSADLVALARVGLALLERVRECAEGRTAVQFFDVPPAASEKPACPVCGAVVADAKVNCKRCRTPHHRECWEYAHGCSMFACGETRFSF